jgi:CysZ protein
MNAPILGLTSALHGPGYLLEGFRMLRLPGLRRYAVLPALGNLLIFAIAAVTLFLGLDAALDRWLPQGLEWLRWIVFPLVALLLLAVGMFVFTMLAAILLSPFLGRLAAEVERRLDGTPSADGGSSWRETFAGIAVELRRLVYVAACLLGVLVLGLIPAVNLVAPVVGFLVGAWLLAGEYAGNPLGNRNWPLQRQLALLRRHRGRVLAFGSASFGLSLVPGVNLVVVPASAIGMTLLCRDLLALEAQPETTRP